MNNKEIVKLLKVARLMLWNGVGDIDYKTGNSQMYVCIAICNAGDLLETPESVINELRTHVSKLINGECTATGFMHRSGITDLSSTNIQRFRRSILDDMIAKYKREPEAIRTIKNASTGVWRTIQTIWK